jgi:hypothetical protein
MVEAHSEMVDVRVLCTVDVVYGTVPLCAVPAATAPRRAMIEAFILPNSTGSSKVKEVALVRKLTEIYY